MNLVQYREKINRINLTRRLNKKQKEINKLYEKEGLTDRVLEMQVELNKERNEYNIPDGEFVNDEGFSQ